MWKCGREYDVKLGGAAAATLGGLGIVSAASAQRVATIAETFCY
jgi:hypothetical protein